MSRKVSFMACVLGLLLFISATLGAFLKVSPFKDIMPSISYGIDLQGGHRVVLSIQDEPLLEGIHYKVGELIRHHAVIEDVQFSGNGDVMSFNFMTSYSIEAETSDIKAEFAATLKRELTDLDVSGVDNAFKISGLSNLLDKERYDVMSSNIQVINSRLNAMGTADVSVFKQGNNKIVIELPLGVDYEATKELLLSTTQVNFFLPSSEDGSVQMTYRSLPVARASLPFIRGESIVEAYAGVDQRSGSAIVSVKLDSAAAKVMSDVSSKNIGRPIITTLSQKLRDPVDGGWNSIEDVINVASIQTQLGRSFQITGIASHELANSLAVQLKSGALSAPMVIVMEQSIDPRLGADNIEAGVKAFAVGLLLLFAYIVYHYRIMGVVTCLTLSVNVCLITYLLSIMDASFTLTGIAGLVLTMGIAVDANIIVFERFRAETSGGIKGLVQAFSDSFSTIMDANVTTILASIVLFNVGSVALKGFAVTLGLGVVSTVVTAYMLNKFLLVSLEGFRLEESVNV